MPNNPFMALMQMMNGGISQNQILQQMAQNNPKAKAALAQMQQSGMSLNDYMLKIAKQNGSNSVQEYAQQMMRQNGMAIPQIPKMPMQQRNMPNNGRK